MVRLSFWGILFLTLTACQSDDKTVFVRFIDSEGIRKSDQVMLHGASVGVVKEVELTEDYEVIVSLRLSESVDFPVDTRFEIKRQNLTSKGVHVTLGKSETSLQHGDTIYGISSFDPRQQLPCSSPRPAIFNEIKELLQNN